MFFEPAPLTRSVHLIQENEKVQIGTVGNVPVILTRSRGILQADIGNIAGVSVTKESLITAIAAVERLTKYLQVRYPEIKFD